MGLDIIIYLVYCKFVNNSQENVSSATYLEIYCFVQLYQLPIRNKLKLNLEQNYLHKSVLVPNSKARLG